MTSMSHVDYAEKPGAVQIDRRGGGRAADSGPFGRREEYSLAGQVRVFVPDPSTGIMHGFRPFGPDLRGPCNRFAIVSQY